MSKTSAPPPPVPPNRWSEPNSPMIEFLNLIGSLLGIDITYEEFSKMSNEERKSFIRDVKIRKMIE